MSKKEKIVKFEAIISSMLEYIMGIFFFIIFIIVFALVLLRYGFSKSIFGGAEFVTVLFIYATAFGTALLFRERSHIRILYFLEKIPIKIRKITIIFAYIMNIIFHISLFYFSLSWIGVTGQYRTAILKVPYWFMQTSIPIYASIAVCYLIRNIILVIKNNKYINLETKDNNVEL